MSRDELLAAILRLPLEEQQSLIDEVNDRLPVDEATDPGFTPEILPELEAAHQDMVDNPDDEVSIVGAGADTDMTPALRAELERRYEDVLKHPYDGSSWEEVSARLLARKNLRT